MSAKQKLAQIFQNQQRTQLDYLIDKRVKKKAINAVASGNGLTGGGVSGDITLAVDINGATDGTGITVSDSDLLLVADANDSNNVKKINISQLPSSAGDITGVTAGNGLSGGGNSGAVTLAVDINGATDGTGITVSNSDLILLADANDSNNVKKVNVSQLPSSATDPAGSDTQLQYNDDGAFGAIASVTWNGTNLSIADDTKLIFGTNSDASIEYNENGDDYLIISGSSNGMVLSGSTVEVDGVLGIGVAGNSVTHAITLPESDTNSGKIKATAYTTYSSVRYKENIKPISNPLQIINNLEGVTFEWKKSQSSDIGFVAEQVGKYLPNVVEWEKNGVDAQSMDYNKIVPILVEAIKNQQSQIDQLKDEIIFLKSLPKDN